MYMPLGAGNKGYGFVLSSARSLLSIVEERKVLMVYTRIAFVCCENDKDVKALVDRLDGMVVDELHTLSVERAEQSRADEWVAEGTVEAEVLASLCSLQTEIVRSFNILPCARDSTTWQHCV
jgi:hypothetical protein